MPLLCPIASTLPSPAPVTLGSSPTQTGGARAAPLTTRVAGIHSAFPPSREASSRVTRRVRARSETHRLRWSADRPARPGIHRPHSPRAHRGQHPPPGPRPGCRPCHPRSQEYAAIVEASDASCGLGRKSPQPAQETCPSPGPLMGGTSGQRLQQRLGLPEVSGVKALGEPAVDGSQQFAGFGTLALLLPQAAQARRCSQFQ